MFNEKDMALHRGLMKLLDDGAFTLKAREVGTFIEIYRWADGLKNRKPDISKEVKKKRVRKKKVN